MTPDSEGEDILVSGKRYWNTGKLTYAAKLYATINYLFHG